VLKLEQQRISEIVQIDRLVSVIIWNEMHRVFVVRDSFVNVHLISEALKSAHEGISEIVQTARLVSVAIWSVMNGMFMIRDSFVNVH